MARPSKLTPELQQKICELIEDGNYPAQSATMVGIHEATYYDWMKRGREAKNKSKFTEFFEAIKKSESKAESYHVKIIKEAAKEKWTASAWYLERKHPERWGKREKVALEHSGEIQHNGWDGLLNALKEARKTK